jgi:hypothetical protein
MSYTYSSWITAAADLLITQTDNDDFVTIIPSAIDYAEQRIYRELDLLQTRVTNSSSALASGNRNFALPSGYVVVEELNLISPAGTSASAGTRYPLVPVARPYLDYVYPGNLVTGQPVNFAMVDQNNVIVGPAPDGNYVIEVVGTQRPTPLSASNTTTFLTTNLPDLWMAATMIFFSGFQKNFGAQGDDPKMAVSWESQYQALRASADSEEWRKRFMASAWSSIQPSREAQPARN